MPKLHPERIKLANLKTLQHCKKLHVLVTEDEHYREKGVTTVTQMGGCVFHFRVSDAESSSHRHKGAYALKERK